MGVFRTSANVQDGWFVTIVNGFRIIKKNYNACIFLRSFSEKLFYITPKNGCIFSFQRVWVNIQHWGWQGTWKNLNHLLRFFHFFLFLFSSFQLLTLPDPTQFVLNTFYFLNKIISEERYYLRTCQTTMTVNTRHNSKHFSAILNLILN